MRLNWETYLKICAWFRVGVLVVDVAAPFLIVCQEDSGNSVISRIQQGGSSFLVEQSLGRIQGAELSAFLAHEARALFTWCQVMFCDN